MRDQYERAGPDWRSIADTGRKLFNFLLFSSTSSAETVQEYTDAGSTCHHHLILRYSSEHNPSTIRLLLGVSRILHINSQQMQYPLTGDVMKHTNIIDWEYQPPPDIGATLTEALRSFPRQPKMLIYAIRSVAALLLRGWLRLYHRLRIEGRENLPECGSYVLLCNHTSHLDALCLLSSVPLRKIHQTFPAAAADYFFSSFLRTAASAILINALPFERKVKGEQSLSVCSKLLGNEGNILVLFPEGTRATTGKMGRFRSGVGRLVASADVAVVPCHLAGGLKAWPKGRGFPRPHRLHLRIGTPRTYSHLAKTPECVREICQDLQQSVADLGRLEA